MPNHDPGDPVNIGVNIPADRQELRGAVTNLNNWIAEHIEEPVSRSFGFRPAALRDIFNLLADLTTQINAANPDCVINKKLLPWLKLSVIHERRTRADQREIRSSRTFNPSVLEHLDEQVAPIEQFLDQEWYRETQGQNLPKLTDYLTVIHAEGFLDRQGVTALKDREYDEKFNILTAPTLFLPDLSAYRALCDLRRRSMAIAYIDIDEFKSFNTEYGEPRVDRDLLPRFMTELEAHVFSHGIAYRFGGDEYMVLLPNMNGADAASFLKEFQVNLESVDYHGIDRRPTVSIGIVEVNSDCILTNPEIEEKAADAKQHAKENGRNRVAGYKDSGYTNQDLEILD